MIHSVVVKGNQIGRTLGFPTANLETNDTKLCPGVYAARVEVKGQQYLGVLNIGFRPTICEEKTLTAEVHILNFDDDIYGEKISVEPLRMLRTEKKFISRNELIKQINKDVSECLSLDFRIN